MSERSIVGSAFTLWNAKPDILEGGRTFSMHKNSGIAAMFGVLAGLSLVEGACVHLVVRHWSPRLDWVSSGFSIYGAVLLMAIAGSFALRPMVRRRSADQPNELMAAVQMLAGISNR